MPIKFTLSYEEKNTEDRFVAGVETEGFNFRVELYLY